MTHPARQIDYDQLLADLTYEVEAGNVTEQLGDAGLRLYCYTNQCAYDKKWNDVNIMARGLILDTLAKEVIATPFPKFFNASEHGLNKVPELPYEICEKLDGSLIIVYYHNGKWNAATKGSFNSEQAKWAKAWIDKNFDVDAMKKDHTYLFEALYPENRIVVKYAPERYGMHLLGAYTTTGYELPYEHLVFAGEMIGTPVVKNYGQRATLEQLQESSKTLDGNHEGFVVRFSNGLRLKFKGEEYCKLHKLVSSITPLAIWELMKERKDIEAIRKDVPEEFLLDFNNIIHILSKQITELVDDVIAAAETVKDLNNRELGLQITKFDDRVRCFIFPCRRESDFPSDRTIESMYRDIRPTGNKLEGYTPSIAMNRVVEEDV